MDAFTVDGSAPADSVNLDSSGRLLVGTSTARANFFGSGSFSPYFQLEGTTTSATAISTHRSSNDDNQSYVILSKARSSSFGVVSSGDGIGEISFQGADGTNLIQAARITAAVDGTPGTNDMPGRLIFATTADGASSPTTRLILKASGQFTAQGIYDFTSASAANVQVDSAGNVSRSTSSIKYKTNVETLEDAYADEILNCRPVWYRSLCSQDDPSWGWWGFIAEEVAEIDPRLVHWKTTESVIQEDGSRVDVPLESPEPEGVQYDRFVPHLLNLIKRQGEAIAELQGKIAALEAA